METFIYILQDPITGDVRYVGKTINPQKRYYQHCYKNGLLKNNNHKNNWILKLLKSNLKPIMTIIDQTNSNWEFLEKYWIEQFKQWGFNLTNIADGGQGCTGFKWTEEMKSNHSAKKKGIPSKIIGIKRDDTFKNKIKLYRIGKKQSDETKAKIGIANKIKRTGVKHYGNRLLESQKCMKKAFEARKKQIILYDFNDNELNSFNSITDAAIFYELSTGFIGNCLAGRVNSSIGIWKYKQL